MATTLYRRIIDIFKENGFSLARHGKGDHDIWKDANGGMASVPRTIKNPDTAKRILKSAGILVKKL